MYSDNYDPQTYDEENYETRNALNLEWVLGLNYSMFDGVHNLVNESRNEIFYASAHTGIIYDYKLKTQRLLQGHCNRISCTAYCPTEDILITADSGPDSMLVVWDARTGTPRKTIFDPHPRGCLALDVSPDGRYIVTLSAEEKKEDGTTALQKLTLWDWSSPTRTHLVNCPIDPRLNDTLLHVRFNPDDPKEIATTGKRRLLFWKWEEGEKGFEFYGPSYNHSRSFTQTAFIPGSKQAVTGTNDGYIVVWDISLIMEDYSQPEERRAIKVVNLMNTSNKSETAQKRIPPSINILKIQGNYLVVGASNGSIRFYDFQYRIIAWFEEFKIGDITSISFSQYNPYRNDSSPNLFDDQASKEEAFNCPDFIVVDRDSKITLLRAKYFEAIEEKDKLKEDDIILQSIVKTIECIAVRPNSHTLAISCDNGHLYEWDYHTKEKSIRLMKNFQDEEKDKDKEKKDVAVCVEYSPDGRYLVACTIMNNGGVHIYDFQKASWQPKVIPISENFKSRALSIVFANDSKHFALYDDCCAVTLFRVDHQYGDTTRAKEWVFAGKSRVHTLAIKGVAFGQSVDEGGEQVLRLFSIGEDKRLVEYDVKNSNQDLLKVVSIFAIEQECIPTACIWYPNSMQKEDLLLVANEEYKLKLWNVKDIENRIGQRTCLGPIYGGPINKFLLLNPANARTEYDEKFLAYSTSEKIVGIIKLPVNGNPSHQMGLISHPEEIRAIGCSGDGKFFFTCGGKDQTVNIWRIDRSAFEDSGAQYEGLNGLVNLIEGGEEGQTYHDLKDFFYYSQIRSKDENTTKARKLDGKVPLSEIPNLMRAMGFYPTKKEIENMQNEIKYSKFAETGEFVEELDLEMFVRLFINHKPVNGIGRKQIEESVNELSKPVNRMPRDEYVEKLKTEGDELIQRYFEPEGKIRRDELIDFLTNEGEQMSLEELKQCLNRLTGEGEIDDLLPEYVDADKLIREILEFEDMDDYYGGAPGDAANYYEEYADAGYQNSI